jgi:hypothetical protein
MKTSLIEWQKPKAFAVSPGRCLYFSRQQLTEPLSATLLWRCLLAISSS